MPSNGGRRDVCGVLERGVRWMQLVLRREILRSVCAGAQVKVALGVAPHDRCHWATAEQRRRDLV